MTAVGGIQTTRWLSGALPHQAHHSLRAKSLHDGQLLLTSSTLNKPKVCEKHSKFNTYEYTVVKKLAYFRLVVSDSNLNSSAATRYVHLRAICGE